MSKHWYLRTVIAVLALVSVVPTMVGAVTVKPGTYKLRWQITNSECGRTIDSPGLFSRIPEGEAAKIKGLVSVESYWAPLGDYRVIVDESNGVGSGYDTAYVIRKAADSEGIDLAKAGRVALKSSGSWGDSKGSSYPTLHSDYSERGLSAQALVEITLGHPGAEITKKAEAEPTVYMKPDTQGKVRPYKAELQLSGGWSGRVGSDIGPIRLYTSDRNANGVYNDPNDAAVLSVTRSYDQSWNSSSNVELPAGRVGNIGGKLFIVEVSAVGDTVKLKPYTGSTGKVNVSTFDSSGKPAKVSTVSFAGDTGRMSYYSKTTSGFVLPSGSYSCTVTVQLPVKAKYGGYETLDMKTKTPVTVSKGKTTSIRFGGPLQMQIGSGKGPIEVKQGIGRDIMVTFSTPNSSVDTSTGLTIPVNVRNATGKVVWSSTAEYT